jgi:hypothetical protein
MITDAGCLPMILFLMMLDEMSTSAERLSTPTRGPARALTRLGRGRHRPG